MLFRKKIERSCIYCCYSTKISNDLMLCTKKGVCSINGKCWRFKYDPCKRIPLKARPLDFSKYDDEDFSL